MKYYPCWYRLNGKRRYLIWISDTTDAVEVGANGFVPVFADMKALRRYAKLKGYTIERDKPKLLNLDRIGAWLGKPVQPIDCVTTLDAWNLFSDISASFPRRNFAFKKIDKKFPKIYDKVFWGCNLPPVTPVGKSYEPIWSAAEMRSIGRLMTCGLDLFVKVTQNWPNSKEKKARPRK